MSAITDTQSSQPADPFGAYAPSATKRAIDDPQDRFLKLLVTQMKNQDPLNPLDNAQVTSQLAQISTVNGIEKLNATIQGMVSSFAAGQSLQAAGMIGKEVLVPGATLQLAGGKGLFGINLPEAADQVKVTIHDASGGAVQVIDLGEQAAGPLNLAWDGKTQDGTQVPDGIYTLSVNAMRGDQKVEVQTLTSGTVDGVAQGDQGVKLHVGSQGFVGLADIKQIF
jgi:flagellar basal-body rod modification protein FlgD